MNVREQGFLLLTGYLGNPERRPLTIPQFRELTKRARQMPMPLERRDMTQEDLVKLGCDRAFASRVLQLLSQEEQLRWYLEKGRRNGCYPVTRISDRYPDCLRRCLGMDAPGVLWLKGDPEILDRPGIALVGSRDLRPENAEFASAAGKQIARQGYALVSGNARGADRTAQEAALAQRGVVISVVADALERHSLKKNVLYISEEGYDLPFTSQRALRRNRIIHSLGQKTFVAQCTLGKGGTWDGTCHNLQKNLSPVFCFRDGSDASTELEQMGACLVDLADLVHIPALQPLSEDMLRNM